MLQKCNLCFCTRKYLILSNNFQRNYIFLFLFQVSEMSNRTNIDTLFSHQMISNIAYKYYDQLRFPRGLPIRARYGILQRRAEDGKLRLNQITFL